jgi:DNA-binding XRE family transcriptional regulator
MENNIRKFRRELDKSQAWLAKATGMSRQSIFLHESNSLRRSGIDFVSPTEETRKKIAAALGRTPEEVWIGERVLPKGAVVISETGHSDLPEDRNDTENDTH